MKKLRPEVTQQGHSGAVGSTSRQAGSEPSVNGLVMVGMADELPLPLGP